MLFANDHCRPCTLERYRCVVAELSRPSDEQIEDFLRFISSAHSWYKTLPLLPPGVPFTFFLNPLVGFGPNFHYTWITPEQWRSQFGYLTFKVSASPTFPYGTTGDWRKQWQPGRFETHDGEYLLPLEVEVVASAPLTAIIHRNTAHPWYWRRLSQYESHSWPAETGGAATLLRIKSRLEKIRATREVHLCDEIDEELQDILAPERIRLYDTMRLAIEEMLEIVCE